MLKRVDYVTYEVIDPECNQSHQFKLLKKMGLTFSPYIKKNELTYNFLVHYLKKRKVDNEYIIDGIVITDNNDHVRVIDENPPHSFAFKLSNKFAVVKVIDVEWNPSKDAILIPRIEMEPTELGGVTITYATGFNAKFIVDNEIGPGAIVKIIRSGDTIPYITEILKGSKKGPLMPNVEYVWHTTSQSKDPVHIKLKENKNKIVTIKLITKFFKTLGVENVSSGIITKLYDNKFNSIIKIIEMNIDDLLSIDGIQTTLANKIYNNIHNKLKNIDIILLMVASNKFGHGFGESRIRSIFCTDAGKFIMNHLNIKWTTKNFMSIKEIIFNIDGFNEITTNYFIERLPKFLSFYQKINYLIKLKKIPYTKKTKFSNLIFVFTGFRNKTWETIIIDNGKKA